MKTFFLFTAAVVVGLSIIVGISAAQGIVLERTEPDPQQLPCPQQSVQYQCQTMVPSGALTWTLPTGVTLEFSIARVVGEVRNSPDDLYSATLTNKTEDDDPATDRFFFSSSLLVLEPVNGSTLTCAGGTGASPVDNSTTITLSGIPDPPSDLEYDNTVVIESSVDLEWTRPSYTGGVALSNYSISANDQRVVVSDVRENVSHTTSGLVYRDVEVTAINTCGQESEPASLIIPAKAPPNISNFSVELNCEDISSWNILWTCGQKEVGVVYPEEVNFSVNVAAEQTICQGVTADDTNCTTNLPRGVYVITLTQTNDIGSTVNHFMIDTQILTVREDVGPTTFSVIVTVNNDCSEPHYTVMVTFSSRKNGDSGCEGELNVTKQQQLSPGEAKKFSLDTDSLILGNEMELCFIVTLNRKLVITGPDVPVTTSPSPTTSGPKAGSNTALIGGVVGGLVGGVLVAVICVLLIAILWIRHRRNKEKNNDGLEMNVVSPDSPVTKETAVEAGPTYQDPNSISRTPHPTTGEVYTDVNLNTRTKKTEQVDSGPMYQDPSSIEHQEAPSGDVYAMPHKTGKKGKNGRNGGEPEEGLTEEQKAALYSVPDRKTQKAKSAGLVYTDVEIQPSSKPPPPSQGSTYADIKYN